MKWNLCLPVYLVLLLQACGGSSDTQQDDSLNSALSVNLGNDITVDEYSSFAIDVENYSSQHQFKWEQVSGPSLDINNPAGLTNRRIILDAGDYKDKSYTVRLTVSDNTGRSASDEITINVVGVFLNQWVENNYSYRSIKHFDTKPTHLKLGVNKGETYRLNLRSYDGNANLFVYSSNIYDESVLLGQSTNIGNFNAGYSQSEYSDIVEIHSKEDGYIYIVVEGAYSISTLVSYAVSPYLEKGFPTDTFVEENTFQSGSPYNTLLVGNIDNDAELEILTSARSIASLYAWNFDGTTVNGWPAQTNGYSYLSLGNLVGDNFKQEIAFSTGPFYASCTLSFWALNGYGELLDGWPVETCQPITTPPRLLDLNDDGFDEILYLSEGYSANGERLSNWGDFVSHPPLTSLISVADINEDDSVDLLIPETKGGIRAYNKNGTKVDNFSSPGPDEYIYQYIVSPLVIGDITGNDKQEIIRVLHTGSVIRIEVLNNEGNLLWERQTLTTVGWTLSPALGDLDGDNIPELVIQTDGVIHVYKGDGSYLEGWPVEYGSSDSDKIVFSSSALIADVTGDKKQNIIITYADFVEVYSNNGELLHTMNVPVSSKKQHAIADIDLDGRNEIIISSDTWNAASELLDTVWVFDLGGDSHGAIEWGQMGGGPKHLGSYPTENKLLKNQ